MVSIIVIFCSQWQEFSSHMDQLSEHINSSNQKIHSYDQIIKIILNLGSKKFENNDTSTFQLTHIQNSSLMIINHTPEKYFSLYKRPPG